MEGLKFDKETAEALYRIFCGLSRSCYQNAEVYEEAKPNMEKAYEKVLEWGSKYCDNMRGEEKLVEIKSNDKLPIPIDNCNTWDLPSGIYQVSVDKASSHSKDSSCRVWMKQGITGEMIIVAEEYKF